MIGEHRSRGGGKGGGDSDCGGMEGVSNGGEVDIPPLAGLHAPGGYWSSKAGVYRVVSNSSSDNHDLQTRQEPIAETAGS